MKDGYVSWEDTVDPSGCNTDDPINYWTASRDPERTPFQWSADKNAGNVKFTYTILLIFNSLHRLRFLTFHFCFLGFSTADKTWLPVAEGYETLNVEVQRTTERSHLNVYKALAKLRTEPAFSHGRYDSVALNSDVLAFKRLVIFALNEY